MIELVTDWLVLVLKDHMRVAVEDGEVIRCWCGDRFASGDIHREHQAEKIRARQLEVDGL